MPKKANVTNEQIADAVARASDIIHEIMEIAEEIRAGRCDAIEKPLDMAREFTNLARVSADAAGAILVRKAMSDDRNELEATLRARIAADRG